MAVLHRKEEKVQAVLGRLPKKYSPDDFVTMFIKLYSKDWGKIKSAYIKASQDKEPGTIIHMPKPELYLKQILEIFLTEKPTASVETPKKAAKEELAPIAKTAAVVKKSNKVTTEKPVAKTTKSRAKDPEIIEPIPSVKKPRATAKKESK